MYLCSCKGLTEREIREIASELARSGLPSVDSFLQILQLDSDEACGLCAQSPERFIALAMEEWERSRVKYEDSTPDRRPGWRK